MIYFQSQRAICHAPRVGTKPSLGESSSFSRLSVRVTAMNEEEKQQIPVSVVALRAESYSEGGDSIVVSLRTKYSTAERKYSVPVECFHDLIVDLRRLNAAVTPTEPDETRGKDEPFLPLDKPVAAE